MRNGALAWSDERVLAIMSQPVLCLCLIKESNTLLILIPNRIWQSGLHFVQFIHSCPNKRYLLNCSPQKC